MATITDTTTDANGNIIVDVSSSENDSITLATAGNYSDKNIIFNLAIQKSAAEPVLQEKTVTYTSNGTATITPDEGYDGLSGVDVTVNVASVSTVTINCESNDTCAFWLSPDGVFHKTSIKAGANTIIVTPYSPIGVYNMYGYPLKNLNNIVDSGGAMFIELEDAMGMGYFHIYYATAITASATQPTD